MVDSSQTMSPKRDWRDTVTWYTYETKFSRFAKAVCRPPLYSLARVECVGLENIPPSGPGIVAANHFSLLDVLYMGVQLPRYPHFMAKKELYKYPLFGWILRHLGSFPVYRGEGDGWALAQAGRVLEAGQILFMFPEGTRSGRKAQLRRGKAGAVKLALKHQVPLIPAAIWGTQNFKIGWKRMKVNIQVGESLDMVALAGPPPYKRDIPRQLTTLMMQKIAEMLPPEHRGMYG
jgi:1-acyl-sn-glycerol-3-phosphate acyltransferase